MESREPINSQTLQEKFPEIYKDFFSRCVLVCSTPGSFCWAGDYTVMEGGLTVLQKLPLRTYVGISAAENGKIKTQDLIYHQPSENKFTKSELENPPKSELIKFLTDYLTKEYKTDKFPGIEISIITEIPPGCGLNFSGSFSVALASALSLYNSKIKRQDLENWKKIHLPQLLKTENKFDSFFRLAWKIGTIFHGGISSGGTAFVPFFDSTLPIVYWSQKRGGTSHLPKDIKNDYRIIDQIFYQGIRLEELFNFKNPPNWPIDFGLIYSGDVRTTATTHITIEASRDVIKQTCQSTKQLFAPLISEKLKPDFITFCENSQWRALWSKYIDPLTILTLEFIHSFKNIFKEGMSNKGIKTFLDILNRYHCSLHLMNLSSPILDYICFCINNTVRNLGDECGGGAKLIGAGIKGDVLFAVAYHGLRDQIGNIIKDIKQKTGENIFLDYASWIDGREEIGVKVEQYLKDKIYSDFISPGSFQIRHLNKDGVSHTDLHTFEGFEKSKKDMELLLDQKEHKIYILGKQLTSKEIRSAATTIELFKILLQNLDKSLTKNDLPASSYFADRNELQSKIITPLNQAIKKNIKKDLDLKVTGGIRDYSVKLNRGNLNIYLIEKTF